MASSSSMAAPAVVSKAWSCTTLHQASVALDTDAMMETPDSIRDLLTQSSVHPNVINDICKSMHSQETVPASLDICLAPSTPSPPAPTAAVRHSPMAPEAPILAPVKVEDQVDLRDRIAQVRTLLVRLTAIQQQQAFISVFSMTCLYVRNVYM